MNDKQYHSKVRELTDKEKWNFDQYGLKDFIERKYTKNLIIEAFKEGVLVSGKELYRDNQEKLKKYGEHYYCLHSYTEYLFRKYIMINFYIRNNEVLIVHHCGPFSTEIRYYKKKIKEFSHQR